MKDNKVVNSNPIMVLVRPQLGQNIGMCARAMKNFCISNLTLVNPREGNLVVSSQDTLRASSGADDIVKNANIYSSIQDATLNCTHVYSLSNRKRDLNKKTVSLKQACSDTAKNILQGERTAFLFGPEASGLSNEDIQDSNSLISIETNEDFASLNLSQSVMLVCYELFKNLKAKNNPNAQDILQTQSELASQTHYQHFFKSIEQKLENTKNKELTVTKLKNIFLRSELTVQEINLLYLLLK